MRKPDKWIRGEFDVPNRNVQAVNSLWGAVLAQAMMFVLRARELFPGVNVTEAHPKALLRALGRGKWDGYFKALEAVVTLDAKRDHQRDAVVSAVAAREGFEGRWTRDLTLDRYPSEQDPSSHWLGPVHHYWPG